jgi:translation initiation factor 1
MAGQRSDRTRPAYSTDKGDLRKAEPEKMESATKAGTPVRVSLDTKGRRGKPVTLIADIPHNPQVIDDIARQLKALCGAGGTVEGRTILIQGDHRDKVCARLEQSGMRVKRV